MRTYPVSSELSRDEPRDTDRVRLFVIIEHRQVLIFRSDLVGGLPEHVAPYDPESNGQHVHSIQDHKGNIHRPAAPSFYIAIAASLKAADEILIFSTRAGGKSLMDNLLAELELNHPGIARSVVGALLVEERHISEEDLLARARAFYHAQSDTAPV